MPPRRNVRGALAAKREYQWFGGQEGADVDKPADMVVADIFQLRPSFLSADGKTSGKIVRIVLNTAIRRNTTALVGPPCWVVTVAPVDSAGNLTDVLELTSNDPFVWGNKRIVQCGMLPVPPNNVHSGGVAKTSEEQAVSRFDFKVNRNIDWKREAIAMQVNADISGVLRIVIGWRILVQM